MTQYEEHVRTAQQLLSQVVDPVVDQLPDSEIHRIALAAAHVHAILAVAEAVRNLRLVGR